MHLSSVRRLGLVGLTTVALALPTSAAVASTSGVDAPHQSKRFTTGTSGYAKPLARTAADAPSDVTKLSFHSSATYDAKGAFVLGRVYWTGDVESVTTQVRVNGVYKGTVEIEQNPNDATQFGFVYRSGWGAGEVVLGPSTVTRSDSSTFTDTTKSGKFRIRYGVATGTFSAKRYGSKMTFKAIGVKMFKIHKLVSAERAEIQVKTSKGWVTKKYVKLAANGNSPSWTIKTGKHYWRLLVTTNSTRQGSTSEVVHL